MIFFHTFTIVNNHQNNGVPILSSIHIELTFFSIVDILSCSTSFVLGLLFLTSKSENKKANIFLGMSLLSLAGEVLSVLSESAFEEITFNFQTSLFTIPFLLLYINQTINSNIKFWYWLLFLPGIISNFLSNIYIESEALKFVEYIFNVSILVYILTIIKVHKERANNFYSDLEHKTLLWIKLIVFIFLGFHLLWLIEDIVAYQSEEIIEYFASLSSILTFFMIFWIGHNGFSQQETFKQKLFSYRNEIKLNNTNSSTNDIEKYDSICLKIKNEKLFTNPKLDLRTLSKLLNISEKEVSRIINQHSKRNFYQFINQFRVNEFKILLESPKAKQLSIIGLALEAGFNSKSTFYSAFKSIEGITPKQYEMSLK